MDSREDFLKRLKTGEKRKMKVGLIDDNSDVLKKQITEQIDCYIDEISIKKANAYANKEITRAVLLGYDILFFDATYEDAQEGLSAISALEELIHNNPAFADKSRVLIGEDILRYAQIDNTEINELINRALKLPHIVYGNEKGTKVENMLKQIKGDAKRKGIEVRNLLPKGECSPELLKKVMPYVNAIQENLMSQSKIAIDIAEGLREVQPTNETERGILERLKTIADLLYYNQHLIVQHYQGLNSIRNKELAGFTADSDERTHE